MGPSVRSRRATERLARRLKVLEGLIVNKDDQPLMIISGYDDAGVQIVIGVRGLNWALDDDEARAWGEANRDLWDTERTPTEPR